MRERLYVKMYDEGFIEGKIIWRGGGRLSTGCHKHAFSRLPSIVLSVVRFTKPQSELGVGAHVLSYARGTPWQRLQPRNCTKSAASSKGEGNWETPQDVYLAASRTKHISLSLSLLTTRETRWLLMLVSPPQDPHLIGRIGSNWTS